MSEGAVKIWLQARQRKALLSSNTYLAITSLAGVVALFVNFGVVFLVCKLSLLMAVPILAHPDIWASLLGVLSLPLLFIDSRRTERDDMSVIPAWLAREYFHIGPRLMRDGWRQSERARELARIDTDCCAQVLIYLLSRTGPTSSAELKCAFPLLAWEEIAPQLRAIDGVILFRNVRSVSLLAPLRRELRQLLKSVPSADIPREEPEAIPVDEPRQLSPREILGVSSTASLSEIKLAYRNRVKECHPDRFPNLDEHSRQLAEEWTKALNAAYSELVTERK
jgi:hypothetical protein